MKLLVRLGMCLGCLIAAFLIFAFTVWMRLVQHKAIFAMDALLPLFVFCGLIALFFGTSLRDRPISEGVQVCLGLVLASACLGYAILLRASDAWLIGYFELADTLGLLP